MASPRTTSPRRAKPAATDNSSGEVARVCARLAEDKKAENIAVLDLTKFAYVTDYFVIASGSNPRQLHAISNAIQQEMRKRGTRPVGFEGAERDQWILLDYGDIVIHLFDPEWRRLYDLEMLWDDAPRIEWELPRRRRAARKTEDSDDHN